MLSDYSTLIIYALWKWKVNSRAAPGHSGELPKHIPLHSIYLEPGYRISEETRQRLSLNLRSAPEVSINPLPFSENGHEIRSLAFIEYTRHRSTTSACDESLVTWDRA